MKSGEDPTQTPTEPSPEETGEPSLESPESQPSNLKPDGADSEKPPQELEELVVVPAEGAEVFQHPLLVGKSTEEIEVLISVLEGANREQNEELNKYHARVQELQPAAPAPVVEESPYGEGFMAEGFETLEKRTKEAMREMIKPLQEEVRAGKTSSVRENLRGKLSHFTVLESTIDGLLREQGHNPATTDERLLISLYYTALGAATERKIPLDQTETPTREEQPVNIPQHRPSAAPLSAEPAPTVRPLTEQEKRLAYIQFPNHEDPEGEYRRMQSIEEDEVVEPGFSKEGW